MLAVEWSTYPLVAGLVIVGLVVGALVIRAVMPIKLDVTIHEHPPEVPPEETEQEQK